mgnify:CR=1 FL=1
MQSAIKSFVLLWVLFIWVNFTAQAQSKILLVDSNALPIPNALIEVKPIIKGCGYYTVYSDDNGQAVIYDSVRLQLRIIATGYKTIMDSILPNQSKTIVLPNNFSSIGKLVLTGTSQPVPIENSVNRVRTISQEKIQSLAAVSLQDVLVNEVNIQISQDAQLGAGLSLRGIGGQHIKVLIDGVAMIGRNDGALDLGQINMNNVERIEIIEGPMSIIYGTDAIGGVINIITKAPTKNSKEIKLQQYFGSLGTFNTHASISYGRQKHLFNFNITRYLFQGYDIEKDKRNQTWKPKRQYILDGNYTTYFGKRIKQRFTASYFDEYLVSKGSPTINAFQAFAFDDFFNTNRVNLSSQTSIRSLKKSFHFNITNAYNYYKRVRTRKVINLLDLSEQISTAANDQDTQQYRAFNSRGLGGTKLHKLFNLGFGYDIYTEMGNSSRLKSNATYTDVALFYALQFNTKHVQIEQGLRASYNSQFNVPLIPSIHVKYKLKENWFVFGSYAKGYRAPSIKERYLDFVDQSHDVSGNENLKSEESHTLNGGFHIERESKKYSTFLEVNSFYTQIKHKIILAQKDVNTLSYEYQNIEQFYNKGINFRLNLAFKKLEINTGVGIVGNKQLTDSIQTKASYLYRPDAQFNVSYMLNKIKTKFSFLNKLNGAQPNYLKENNTVKLQYSTPFLLSDISAMRTFANNKLLITLTVKNIFNINNIQNTGNIGTTHSTGSNSANVALGRFYAINLIYTIKK